MKKIAVFVSGAGENLQAIMDHQGIGDCNYEVVSVISNNSDAYALQRAESAGIETRVFQLSEYVDKENLDEAIKNYLNNLGINLIVLAGYMRILTPSFIQHYLGKIINIHPSLLPKYPGLNTYQKAIGAGDTEHGTTVHFVNELIDDGPVILQAKVPIFVDDDIQDIVYRVKEQEKSIYPLAISWFVNNRLILRDNHAYLDNKLLGIHGYASDD